MSAPCKVVGASALLLCSGCIGGEGTNHDRQEVTLAVTDSATGDPVVGAKIGICGETDPGNVVFFADDLGEATLYVKVTPFLICLPLPPLDPDTDVVTGDRHCLVVDGDAGVESIDVIFDEGETGLGDVYSILILDVRVSLPHVH